MKQQAPRALNLVFTSGLANPVPLANEARRFHVVHLPAERTAHRGPKLRTSAEGPEKLCTRCMEWWPADGEFFHSDPTGAAGLFFCCKACYWERKLAKKAAPST